MVDRCLDRAELGHHRLVDLQPPGGVEEHRAMPEFRACSSARARSGPGALVFCEDRDFDLRAERLQLLDRRRPVHVAGDEQRTPSLLAQTQREFGGLRRLAAALQSGEHDRRRPARRKRSGSPRAHQLDEPVAHDLHDRLRRGQRLEHFGADGALADRGDEVLDDGEIDVGFEQRDADLPEDFRDVASVSLPRERNRSKIAPRRSERIENISTSSRGCGTGGTAAASSRLLADLFDVLDRVADRLDLLGLLVGDVEIEFGLKGHHQFHLVERIRAEVVGDRRIHRHFAFLDAELLDDGLFDFLEH